MAARRSDEDVEGFEGLSEEDFFTFDFDENEEDVGFDLELENDGNLE